MQTKPLLFYFVSILLVGYMTACNSYKSARRSTTRSDTTVNTEAVTEHPNPPPSPILSSQKGPNGSQVDLTKAQINGGTLTVELQYKSDSTTSRSPSSYAISQVIVTDEATAKTYSVLKDQSGKYMASPLSADKEKQTITINTPSAKDKPVLVRFTFPAPPVDSKTISVTIPEVGTYKAIPLSR